MRKSVRIQSDPTTAKPSKAVPSASQAVELVQVERGKPTTTSRIVAEHFGKSHKSVIRALGTLMAQTLDDDFNRHNFAPIEFTDSRGRKQSEWAMTEDGFAVLVMGFTGAKAANLRVSFVKAFREANERIRQMEQRQADPAWLDVRELVDNGDIRVRELPQPLPCGATHEFQIVFRRCL
jgi:Rha family phage regulatory protein